MRGIIQVILTVAAATSIAACSKQVSVESCEIPVLISLSEFDPRFGVTEDEFRQAAYKAASIWNDATKGEAITFSDDGIPVNFVYGENQARRNAINTLDELEHYYQKADESLRAALDHVNELANTLIEQHNAMNSDYRNSEIEALEDIAEVIISHTETLIDNKYSLLRLLDDDQPSSSIAGWFKHGAENKIEIFDVHGYQDLVMLLAHEFGHAIGVTEHVEEPYSIMFESGFSVTPDQAIELTPADLDAYKRQCG